MLFRVVRPMKRPESSKHYFRQRIPLDVLDRARGQTVSIPLDAGVLVTKAITQSAQELKFSLRTSDASVAKSRNAIAAAYLETFWRSLRAGPKSLTHKQCVALSGEIYAAFTSILGDDPGSPELWKHMKAADQLARDGHFGTHPLSLDRQRQSLENRFGRFADALLARKGLVVDDISREKLLQEVARAMDDTTASLQTKAEGDYRPDDRGERFPKWEEAKTSKPKVSLTDLLDGWWREVELVGKSESTRESYRRTISYLTEFLGHEDATRITPDDVVAFKDHRLHVINPRTGKTASPKTVKDSDLAALKSLFSWGLSNRLIPSNPALGITVRMGRKIKIRPNYFSEEERKAILSLCREYRSAGREDRRLSMAKRWVPWILAYTGARVGEIAQLRQRDVYNVRGHWVLRITPEAGTVKNKEAREVTIHEHLIAEGLIDFVQSMPEGYLFLKAKEGDGDPKGPRDTLKNRLADFVRAALPNGGIAPNHGWRHTFKTLVRNIDLFDPVILDYMVGHTDGSVSAKYGGKEVEAMANLLKRFPRLT